MTVAAQPLSGTHVITEIGAGLHLPRMHERVVAGGRLAGPLGPIHWTVNKNEFSHSNCANKGVHGAMERKGNRISKIAVSQIESRLCELYVSHIDKSDLSKSSRRNCLHGALRPSLYTMLANARKNLP